jgi:hypothetical protein
MNAIKVKKSELLDKLKTNRAAHSAQFEKAVVGYRVTVIKVLEQRLEEARKGKLPQMIFNLPLPVDQTKAYDRAIGMLELSVDDHIDLEEHDYQQYVLDEWGWSAATTATNASYFDAAR